MYVRDGFTRDAKKLSARYRVAYLIVVPGTAMLKMEDRFMIVVIRMRSTRCDSSNSSAATVLHRAGLGDMLPPKWPPNTFANRNRSEYQIFIK